MKTLIAIYICIEIALQYILKSAIMDADMIQFAEWFSRFAFTFASIVFMLHFTKNRFYISVIACCAFAFTYNAFPIITSFLDSNTEANMIYNLSQIKERNVVNVIQSPFDDHPQFNKEMNKKVSDIHLAKENIIEKYQNGRYDFLIKKGVSAERATNAVYYGNERYLKTMFQNSKVQNASKKFYQKTGLRLGTDIDMKATEDDVKAVVTKKFIDENKKALEVAVLIPLGFILSTIGIIVNVMFLIVSLLKYDVHRYCFITTTLMFITYNISANGALQSIVNVVKMYT